jgi:shikimate 5-dehydrogenase
LYWNKLVGEIIDSINTEIGGRGIIDRLSGFEITIPFKNSTQDHIHYTSKTAVDSFSAELIHKLDLCS